MGRYSRRRCFINYTDDQPGVKNLLDLLIAINGSTVEELLAHYEGKGYADLKNDVAEAIISELKPLQDKVAEILKDSILSS